MHAGTLRASASHHSSGVLRVEHPPLLRACRRLQPYPNPLCSGRGKRLQTYPNPDLRACECLPHTSAAPGRGARPPRAAAGRFRAPRRPGPRRRCPAARARRRPPGLRPRGTATAPGRTPSPRRADAGRRARRSTRPGTRARWARLRAAAYGQGRAVRRLCAARWRGRPRCALQPGTSARWARLRAAGVGLG